MAAERVRRWAVRPDTSIWTETYGEIPCVSRQAMGEAIMDGEAFLARSGGVLSVVVQRQPTDVPGEAVTTSAIVEWKPGPNATMRQEPPSQPQPAPSAEGHMGAAPLEPPEPPQQTREQAEAEHRAAVEALAQQQVQSPPPPPLQPAPAPAPEVPVGVGVVTSIGDGLDGMDGEDTSELPEEYR